MCCVTTCRVTWLVLTFTLSYIQHKADVFIQNCTMYASTLTLSLQFLHDPHCIFSIFWQLIYNPFWQCCQNTEKFTMSVITVTSEALKSYSKSPTLSKETCLFWMIQSRYCVFFCVGDRQVWDACRNPYRALYIVSIILVQFLTKIEVFYINFCIIH